MHLPNPLSHKNQHMRQIQCTQIRCIGIVQFAFLKNLIYVLYIYISTSSLMDPKISNIKSSQVSPIPESFQDKEVIQICQKMSTLQSGDMHR